MSEEKLYRVAFDIRVVEQSIDRSRKLVGRKDWTLIESAMERNPNPARHFGPYRFYVVTKDEEGALRRLFMKDLQSISVPAGDAFRGVL